MKPLAAAEQETPQATAVLEANPRAAQGQGAQQEQATRRALEATQERAAQREWAVQRGTVVRQGRAATRVRVGYPADVLAAARLEMSATMSRSNAYPSRHRRK